MTCYKLQNHRLKNVQYGPINSPSILTMTSITWIMIHMCIGQMTTLRIRTIPQLYSDSDSECSSSERDNNGYILLDKLFTDDDDSHTEIIDDSDNITDTNPPDVYKETRIEEARMVMEMCDIHLGNTKDYTDPIQYVDDVVSN